MRPTEAHGEVFNNVRDLVKFINENNLRVTDIVTVLPIGSQVFLIYFA